MNVHSQRQIILSLTVEEANELHEYLDRATENEPNALVCDAWGQLGEVLNND